MVSSDQRSSGDPLIRRGKVDSVSLYEVNDYELAQLQEWSPSSLLLNSGISLISIAASFWIAIATTEIKEPKKYAIFIAVALIGTINGFILFILWLRMRSSVSTRVDKIKARIPVDTVGPAAKQKTATNEKAKRSTQSTA